MKYLNNNSEVIPGRHQLILSLFLFVILLMPVVHAEDDLPRINTLFHNVGNNMVNSFAYGYGLYHVSAIAATYGLVKSGVDWRYYQTMVENKFIPIAGFPAVIVGGIVPLVIPTYLYFKGKSKKDRKMMYTGFALGQAAIISFFISSGYKAITGRHPPEILEADQSTSDSSDDFHFGFMRRGIFDGWPSGHTTNAFAMATTLIELYPDNKTLRWWAMGYAFLVGWGVSTNIHWLSDAVAGALIGYAIGKTVGRNFRELIYGKPQRQNISIGATPNGLQLCFIF